MRRSLGNLTIGDSFQTAHLGVLTLKTCFFTGFLKLDFLFSDFLRLAIFFFLPPRKGVRVFEPVEEVSVVRDVLDLTCNSRVTTFFNITRIAGIEPTHTILKTAVLPLNYIPLIISIVN